MTAIAVTGHIDLSPASLPGLRAAVTEYLRGQAPPLTGLSCLAAGADALFAEAVLALGGRLVAVVPAADYRATQVSADYAPAFDRLLGAAAEVVAVPHAQAGPAAYRAANEVLLSRADRLLALWDGAWAERPGGTADMVRAARAAGLPVDVRWPPGSSRSTPAPA
ncbi:hypothetical protein ABT095_16025 [Kitasatospora sp. NPDC002227]|uniref:hypothetical protein n=1 Tax=Kitasatospora sp. NPDC002227 TaxID=3154773 RepID=UPI00331817FD